MLEKVNLSQLISIFAEMLNLQKEGEKVTPKEQEAISESLDRLQEDFEISNYIGKIHE